MPKDDNSWFKVCHQKEISGDKVKKITLNEIELLFVNGGGALCGWGPIPEHPAPASRSGLCRIL